MKANGTYVRLIVAVLCALAVGSGQLLLASTLPIPFADGANSFQDTSAESLYKVTGSTGGATILAEGDLLLSILNETSMSAGGNSPHLGAGTAYNELTALAIIKVAQKSGGPGNWNFVFSAATSADLATLEGSSFGSPALTNVLNAWVPGTIADAFSDPAQNWSRNGQSPFGNSASGDIQSTINGSEIWQFGFTGSSGSTGTLANSAAHEGWVANNVPTDDLSLFAGLSSGSSYGFFNFDISLLHTGPAGAGITVNSTLSNYPLFSQVHGADGSGNIRGLVNNGGGPGGSDATPWQAFDNSSLAMNLTVPEPSCLALLFMCGLSLLSYAWRRRKS